MRFYNFTLDGLMKGYTRDDGDNDDDDKMSAKVKNDCHGC